MEHSDYGFDRAKFDAVWRRVKLESAVLTPAPAKPDRYTEDEEAARLLELMTQEACDARFYGALAARCSGSMRRALSRLSAEEFCHLKRLRAQYFIRTGQSYAPPNTCPVIYSVPDALRRRYAVEKDGAETYEAEAENARDESLKDTYLALSKEEARHRRILEHMIESLF